MVIGFVSGRTSWQLLRKPEQLTDPSPEGTFRPPAKWQSPRDMRCLALVAQRMPFARHLGAGAVFADGRGHGY
jgi:hypothetical protein